MMLVLLGAIAQEVLILLLLEDLLEAVVEFGVEVGARLSRLLI